MKRFFRITAHQIRGLRNLCECLPMDSIGAEVGSGYGESMELFMQSGRVKEMLCVDTWEADKAEREGVFDQRAALWNGRVHKAKADSIRVAHGFDQKQMFDFVYIDAKHDYMNFCGDLRAWLPLVKVGGIIAGHDFKNDVKRAVREILGGPDKTFDDSSWLKVKK